MVPGRLICIAASAVMITGGITNAAAGEFALLCEAIGEDSDECEALRLSSGEMDGMRGGIGGVAFALVFGGSIANTNANNGALPDGLDITHASDSQVQISGALGSFAGANGAFQIANVNGDNNVVNNSMTINVAIVNGAAPDALSAITSAFGSQ